MVFDYVAGKQDWLANDLPVEGELAETPTLGQLADRDAATCFPSERAGARRDRLEEEKRDFCVVVNEAGIVLGLFRGDAQATGEQTVEQMMEIGPTTFRPHVTAEEARDYLRQKELDPILVTLSDGRLVGALRAKDLENRVGKA